MRKNLSRAILISVFAATAVNASLPTHYRLALIQVGYTDSPARYTKPQLLTAAAEISDYYAQISNHSLNLEITASSITTGEPIARYFGFDAKGNVFPAVSNEDVVTSMALRAWGLDHIDFSHIDGIVIANGFCRGDYTLGAPVTVSGLFLSGTFEVAYDFECGRDPRLAPPGPSGVLWGGWSHEMGHMLEIHSGTVLGGIWNGHPGAYASGYALVDSAYPSSPSAYSVIGPTFMTGDKRVFNGWLPDHEVAIADASVPSVTYALRALTRTPTVPLCLLCGPEQVIKVPITMSSITWSRPGSASALTLCLRRSRPAVFGTREFSSPWWTRRVIHQ